MISVYEKELLNSPPAENKENRIAAYKWLVIYINYRDLTENLDIKNSITGFIPKNQEKN